MIELVFIIMLFVFLIMFIANLYLDNPIFGMLCGFWLIVMASAVLIDGIQLQSGVNITASETSTSVVYEYSDLVLPFSSTSVIFGIAITFVTKQVLVIVNINKHSIIFFIFFILLINI